VFDQAASRKEEDGEIDRGMQKDFLILRTIVLALCSMDEGLLQTGQVLREVAKTQAGRRGRDRECYNLLLSG